MLSMSLGMMNVLNVPRSFSTFGVPRFFKHSFHLGHSTGMDLGCYDILKCRGIFYINKHQSRISIFLKCQNIDLINWKICITKKMNNVFSLL